MYRINELFYSIQGEGANAGRAALFVRFSGCNLECSRDAEGFDCDTEFAGGRSMTLAEIEGEAIDLLPTEGKDILCIFTGGEPALQLDEPLIERMHDLGLAACVETNGTRELPRGLDHIVVSPKTAEHTLRAGHLAPTRGQRQIHELRYVRAHGQALPKPKLIADQHFLSPAWSDDPAETKKNLAWCIDLVKAAPSWRLSVQMHKLWGAR